jgi:uncharacterized SAM-binding protein YcdF (DUF218 family)
VVRRNLQEVTYAVTQTYFFLKYGLLPGTLGLFFLCLTLGFGLLRSPRTARCGAVVLAVLIAGYWVTSMPLGALMLGRLVSIGYSPVDEPSLLADVQAIVVLDGGTRRYYRDGRELAIVSPSSAVRALEAIRLYRALQPSLVVVSGAPVTHVGGLPEGGAVRELFLSAGIPVAKTVLDSSSRNTRESAVNVSALIRARGITRIALVTSSVHMRRAIRAFSAAGIQAFPAPAPLEAPGEFLLWPSTTALDRSWEAWYEVFGLLRDFPH